MDSTTARALVMDLVARLELLEAVTDRSTPGIYVVWACHDVFYEMDTRHPDAPSTVARYAPGARRRPAGRAVHGCWFSMKTGIGCVAWSDVQPGTPTPASLLFGRTVVMTSPVLLLGRLTDADAVDAAAEVGILRVLATMLENPEFDYPSPVLDLLAAPRDDDASH